MKKISPPTNTIQEIKKKNLYSKRSAQKKEKNEICGTKNCLEPIWKYISYTARRRTFGTTEAIFRTAELVFEHCQPVEDKGSGISTDLHEAITPCVKMTEVPRGEDVSWVMAAVV